ncbi:MAG: 3-deoxy-manno-octulosonate cytidylyltransferase [Rickettsiales bacterium]|nr:3-deoxy-manno-octulosonate cytidylyltransferase [Rickettsiales bacterium]
MSNPIILIPARRASTRLPDKPLAMIGDKPMIVHVLERAIEANLGEVVVATDDEEIKNVIEGAGGKAVMTAIDHASGSDRIWEALQIIDPECRYDTIINLQGDLPTLEPSLLEALLEPFENDEVDITTLGAEIFDEDEKHAPSVVKPVITFHRNKQGRCLYFSRATVPWGGGPLYHHIGLYGYRREALERFVSLPPSQLEQRERLEQLRALEAGMRIEITIVDTEPLGVDTQEDLDKARKILCTD